MENKKKKYYKDLILKGLFSIEDVIQLENTNYTWVVNNILKYKEDKTLYTTKEDKTVYSKDGKETKSKNVKGVQGRNKRNNKNSKEKSSNGKK